VRIVHVVPTYVPAYRYGGPIFAVHGLCNALSERGHDLRVFTTDIDGAGRSGVPTGVPVKIDKVSVTYFPVRLPQICWAPGLGHAIRETISNADIVHIHSVFLWPTWVTVRTAEHFRVPYIISPRGMLVKELIKHRLTLAKRVWLALVEKHNVERAAVIHATSQLEADELARFNWRLPRVAVIPNGVADLKLHASIEPAADIRDIIARQPLVLFFGRISWKKGLDRLLHAFACTKHGKLAIVGTDDEGLMRELENIAASLNIADRVSFLRRTVLDTDKEHIFAAAKVFVLPSYSENFGNTVVEAMQRGIPVVVTPEVGAAELVRETGAGIVTVGDPQPLATAIDRLLCEPVLARAMGEAGRRHVESRYGWAIIAERMEELYRETIALRHRHA
jgi:glycosyltransferase involved in cell wall biosynthesis